MSATILIIGLGRIGMGYDLEFDPKSFVRTHARAFSQHPEFDLAAAVDSDSRRSEEFVQAYNCPAYEDLETALK